MRRLLFILILILSLGTQAQSIKEWSPAMESRMRSVDDATVFSLFVRAEGLAWEEALALGKLDRVGTVKGYTLVSIRKPILQHLIQAGALSYVGIPLRGGQVLNDRMVLNNNLVPLHQGAAPLESPLKGEGVIMGIVDAGVELQHPDFHWDDGTTRILKLWDQKFIYDAAHIPQPYGFGTEWTKAEIDAGASNHLDQIQYFGHGTNVTGIACGDGSAIGLYGGAAPMTDMVVVSFDFDRPDFLAEVAKSIQYIFSVADDEGKPVVANTSLGNYYGSHDAQDPAALYIDSLLNAAPGRAVVAAVGNSNNVTPYHLHTEVGTDTSFTWFEHESVLSLNGPGVLFELWSDVEDFQDVRFAIAADKAGTVFSKRGQGAFHDYAEMLGATLNETLFNANGDELASIHYWAQLQGDQVQLQVYLPAPDSSSYLFRFMSTGSGSFDVWSTNVFGSSDMVQAASLPNATSFPAISNYVLPDTRMHIVSSWTCSDQVITVANYVNRSNYVNILNEITTITEATGAIASSSSKGPTRDGRQKPDVAASGTVTLTTGSYAMLEQLIANEPFKVAPGGKHYRNGGSSMSSPVVAGIAALFFEQCPEATWEDLKTALIEHTAGDPNTGTVPNERWGYGKADGYGSVSSFTIQAAMYDQDGFLHATGGTAYQWYLNGEPIQGAVGDSYDYSEEGNYYVEVFNEAGCSRFIALPNITGLEAHAQALIKISPNPSNGLFLLQGITAAERMDVLDMQGRSIPYELSLRGDSWLLDMQGARAGTYILRIGKEGAGQGIKLVVSR
jgi:hypothetical protein